MYNQALHRPMQFTPKSICNRHFFVPVAKPIVRKHVCQLSGGIMLSKKKARVVWPAFACLVALASGDPSFAASPAAGASAAAGASPAAAFHVPVDYYKLPNGLRVVLSPDHTAPTVCVGVYYHIGFRIEPRDRTGFAHLFEHMMFQGSANLGKMEFIKLVQ